MYRALLVDDDDNITKGLQKLVDWAGCDFEVTGTASNGKDGLELWKKEKYDLIVTDIKMPVMDGLEMIRELRSCGCTAQIIIVSAYGEFSYAQEAMRYGVDYYLLKPVEEMVLEGYISHVRDLLDSHEDPVRVISSDVIESQYRLSSNGVIPEVKSYINAHYAEQISINGLADIYSFSPAYLGRIFKKTTGVSFNEYLKNVRIAAACELLDSNPDISINVLINLVGFQDINYFYKQFKLTMGCTPGEYRAH